MRLFFAITFLCLAFKTDFVHSDKKFEEIKEEIQEDYICGKPYDFQNFPILTNSDFPWLALLAYENSDNKSYVMCSGSIISPCTILTAKSCVDIQNYSLKHVYLGVHDFNCQDGLCHHLSIPVESVNVNMKYDVALVKLSKKIIYDDFVAPICLPTGPPPENENYYAAGWGRSIYTNNTGLNIKALGTMQKINIQCYLTKKEKDYICVREEPGSHAHCVSDTGGPLMSIVEIYGLNKFTIFGFWELVPPCTTESSYYSIYRKIYDQELIIWIYEMAFENHTC